MPGESASSWGLTGTETYAITERDATYYRHGGITPYVLRRILAESG